MITSIFDVVAKTWVLVAAILGSAMTFIDGSAVNVALPVIQRELGADAAQMQWVDRGLRAVLVGADPAGRFAGRSLRPQALFLIGIAIFTVASAAARPRRTSWC